MVKSSFILEGPDGGGKTTLANELVTRGYVYKHFGAPAPDEDLFRTYLRATLEVRSSEEPIVFDRLVHGELIYGPLLRGSSKISAAQLTLLERVRRACGVVTILCRPTPLERAAEEWQRVKAERGELLANVEQYRAVWMRYGAFQFDLTWDWLNPPTYVDFTHDSLPEGYAGSPRARFLFVGERIGNTTGDPIDLPFMATDGSSGYLNDAIADAGFRETEIALTNAFDAQGNPRKILSTFARVIALGKKAEAECKRQGIQCHPVPHPQFYRRFHYSRLQEYSMKLKQAAGL